MARQIRNAMDVKQILSGPYSRVLVPEDDGGYSAEILEFPGCFAQGETPEEAYRNLEAAAESWIEAALDLKQSIPEPSAVHDYSGRLVLRLPRGLHRKAAELAAKEETSLNQYIVSAVANRVGADDSLQTVARQLADHIFEWSVRQASTRASVLRTTVFIADSHMDSVASTRYAETQQMVHKPYGRIGWHVDD